VDLKRTMDVQRTQSDPEDPHPRLDDSSFSLCFEVGEETIDSEDRSELRSHATQVRSETSSRFAFEQNGRKAAHLHRRETSVKRDAREQLLPPSIADPPSQMDVSLERSRVLRLRIEKMQHLVSKVLCLVDVGEMGEVIDAKRGILPRFYDERVEEGEEHKREERSRLFKGGFFGRSRVYRSVGTRCEEGREEGDEGQELWNEEGEELSVSLVSDRATKDMQRLNRSGNVRRVEPTSRH
jgi:hypothetical protein